MKRIIVISTCNECPHFRDDDDDYPISKYFCDKLNIELKSKREDKLYFPIPLKCPLEIKE